MKAHLFYTFLAIFVATSVVTLLGVTNVIAVREGHLTALITAFLVELAGAVIAIFKGRNKGSRRYRLQTAMACCSGNAYRLANE